ncbi:acetate/propionate family kinase [Amycolatopsis sp. CA-230715]|uniref:acetate/propionate family kinase n=1 Tax=Amycolatopsis sp. CA-230715 TaxID=2745196 RepID=UPI001C0281AA|nr:acetate kinase [Amycolatopsis sp. CA-230715]QWF77988.1 Acetate kinase [Amycolatopsis sp. CA-230715]
MRVLTLNPGSSSLKASMVVDGAAVGWAAWPISGADGVEAPVGEAIRRWQTPDAVAIRFVHGGARKEPAELAAPMMSTLERLVPFAPVHQPLSLAVAREAMRVVPEVPVVACFDTAFHAHLPDAAAHYPLPRSWTRQNRLRRYGFHGLSCQSALRGAARMLHRDADALRIVCCHLGAGVSVTSIKDGRSVDTSMGYTPLEGAAMATRSGSIDPGLLLHVMRTAPMSPDEMSDALNHRSGLAGMSGTSGDVRAVTAAAAAGNRDAVLALEVYRHRIRREIGAAAMSLDRIDAIVFTGGVSDHQPAVVVDIARGLRVLGVRVPDLPDGVPGDRMLSVAGAGPAVLLVTTREDLELARGAERALTRMVVG